MGSCLRRNDSSMSFFEHDYFKYLKLLSFVIPGKAGINKNDCWCLVVFYWCFLFCVIDVDSCLRRNDSNVFFCDSYYFKGSKIIVVCHSCESRNQQEWLLVSCSVFLLLLFFVLCMDSCLRRNDSSMFFFEHDHFKDS